jgi:peptidoglycan/LPS O-acetylase OafA/YrhL
VKNLKILILLCGAALLALFVSEGLDLTENTVHTLIMLAAYALPTVMGLVALARPPMQSWHGAMALAGFGVAAVRTRIWEQLPDFMDAPGKAKAAIALLVVGVIVSAVAMLKPEAER